MSLAAADSLLRSWWDSISSPDFAHRNAVGQRHLLPMWRKMWLDRIAPACMGRRLVEYGIGTGMLGEYALRNLSVAHYAGVDVSDKSLAAARRLLTRHFGPRANISFHRADVMLSSLQPDVLVSQQVIQHFPSREYTDRFLAQVNGSGAQVVMLQTKLPSRRRCLTAVEGSASLGFCSAGSSYVVHNDSSNAKERLHLSVFGAREVTAAAMVSTAYLQQALRGAFTLRRPPETMWVHGVVHAFHIFDRAA